MCQLEKFEKVDFFTDPSMVEDPYPYFDYLRSRAPVLPGLPYGVVAVSGYDEALDVYRDVETYSSCNSVIGPFAQFPVPLEGSDVGEIIDRYRDQLPMHEHMVTQDPPQHTRQRVIGHGNYFRFAFVMGDRESCMRFNTGQSFL